MNATLRKRIQMLEREMPDPKKPTKDIAPAWLLEAWRAQGLQIDAGGKVVWSSTTG
jgi:hypothetical protein